MIGSLVGLLWRGIILLALVFLATRLHDDRVRGAGTSAAPCTAEAAVKEKPSGKHYLVIGTGGTGGVFFPYGGGLARVLSARMSGVEATAEVTGGSVDNLNLIGIDDVDFGLTTADSADEAIKGQGVYKETGSIPACTIANLYGSFIHVVALGGSGINTVADMKGKRVSVGSAGSSTEAAADRILEAAGLDPQTDVTRDNLSVAESVAAMKDRKIAAFFWIGGLPTSAVTDLVSTPGVKVKFVPTQEYVQPLKAKYGEVYYPVSLPSKIYKTPEDVPGIGIDNLLVVNSAMNEQQVYDVLKTFFDNLEEVHTIHPEAKKLSVESAAKGSPIPYHPGAVRFYKEKGVWRER